MSSSNATPRHLTLVTTSDPPHVVTNKAPNSTKSELVQEFLDTAFQIARKQDFSHRDPLKSYAKRNAVQIRADKDFFPELIGTFQQRIEFEPGDGPVGSDVVVKFGVDITGTMFLFIVEECWNLIFGILDTQKIVLKWRCMHEMRALSNDALRAAIISFSCYDRPWLLLAAMTTAAKRNLRVKFIGHWRTYG